MPKKINLNPILALFTIISVLISAFLLQQNNKARELLAIKTFEDCQKSKSAKTENNTCITEDGREFKNEKPTTAPKEESTNSLRFSNQLFSVTYPQEAKLKEEKDNAATIYFWGETQKEGTEIYDGYSISISQIKNALSIKQIAQKEQKQSREICEEGVSEISEYKSEKIEGYQYTSNCLGNNQNIYTEKGGNKFRISLVWAGKDKYKQEVEKILSSLTFPEE